MEETNFALQWLDYLGNDIYNKGKGIFKYDGKPKYEISKLRHQILLGRELVKNDSSSYAIMPYSELQNFGFTVVMGTDWLWREKQACYYAIKTKERNIIGITESLFKRKLQLQHDPVNRRVRLVGGDVLADQKLKINSGIGPWVVYEEDTPIKDYTPKDYEITKEDYRSQIKKWGGKVEENVNEYLEIKELPAIMSDEGYVVCIRKENTCQRMIVVGESGKGKSIFTNAIASRIFYTWEDRVAWLIDPLDQFNEISRPQAYKQFNELNSLIGNEAKPIPAVQLYLACKNNTLMINKEISLFVTLNFEEFLRKYKFYTFGIKDMDVGDTIRYLNAYIKDIKDATEAEEIKDVMFEKVPNAHKDKGMQAMIFKWKETFETIFKEKFTSNMYIDDGDASDELEVKFLDGTSMKGHPFIMCYQAGLIPVLNISAARRQRWLRNYLADLMQKIVAHQINTPDEKRKRVWIIADELNEIYEIGKKKDNAFSAFEELYRQGRINNIGFVGNTQSLDKLNPEMYKNATHICCVYMKDHKERKRVGDTYNLDKEVYNKIESLKEREMMIFSKEPFVIYDRWGRRKVVTDRKWFKGRILPPVNFHKVPPKGG